MIDLAGQKYGFLTVMYPIGKTKYRSIIWRCICDCGKTKDTSSHALKTKHCTSCGYCARVGNKNPVTHGETKSITYSTWASMKTRCLNKNNPSYKKWYGGKGITLSKRWYKYENFKADMGERPSINHTIERVNRKKGYYKDNCIWALNEQQTNNKSTTRLVTYKEETKSVAQWCKQFKFNYNSFIYRLNLGWSVERIISTPINFRHVHKQNVL